MIRGRTIPIELPIAIPTPTIRNCLGLPKIGGFTKFAATKDSLHEAAA